MKTLSLVSCSTIKNPNQDEIQELVEQLRKLIRGNKVLDKLRNDDSYLLRFLHSCNFNTDDSYKKAIQYYEFLNEQKDWVATDPPENMKTFLDMNVSFVLPQADKDGRRLMLTRIANLNPSKISLEEYSRVNDLWMESILDDPEVQENGISLIADVSAFSWRLLTWTTPSNIKKLSRRLEHVTNKDFLIHIVKTSTAATIALKIVVPLLPTKLRERIKFHFNDIDSLHQHIAPECLPKEYGGTIEINYNLLNVQLLELNNVMAEKLSHYRIICAESID